MIKKRIWVMMASIVMVMIFVTPVCAEKAADTAETEKMADVEVNKKEEFQQHMVEMPQTTRLYLYDDISPWDWFYSNTIEITRHGIMIGLTDTTFGPAQSLARAQFAVILYRMSGQPGIAYNPTFPDVPDGQWYTNAILWANSTGVVKGYDNTGLFGTGDDINREQMAVMMYRYAQNQKYDTSQMAEFSHFQDASNVSEFAGEAMKWAVGSGIITGKNNGTQIDPQGNANRAECATIINRFLERYNPDYTYTFSPLEGSYGFVQINGSQFVYSYTISISQVRTGFINVRIEHMGRNNSPIYDTGVIENIPLIGNRAIFLWSDSWENEGEGRVVINQDSITLTMRTTYKANFNRSTLDREAYQLPYRGR